MKKIIALLVLISMLFTCSLGSGFSDVENHWAILNIIKASNNGFFSGYPDGSFKPNNTITRLEFITIMTKLLDKTLSVDIDGYNNMFDYEDLDENSWGRPFFNKLMYYAHVFSDETAEDIKGMNFAKKIFGENLEPNKPITREEAVALMAEFLDDTKLSDDEISFNDIQNSPFIGDIQKFCKTAIIKGYPDGTFKPQNNITRAEASVIIIALFEQNDFIKKVQWKVPSTIINPEILRNNPEDVVFQALLSESLGDYLEAYQYLSWDYKRNNGIMNSNYYGKIKETHLLPEDFVFDEDTIEIKVKKEKDEFIQLSFRNSEMKNDYLIELVLVGAEDWYINSKNY